MQYTESNQSKVHSPFNLFQQILSMGMMTEYYHYFFTTLVRNTKGLGVNFLCCRNATKNFHFF